MQLIQSTNRSVEMRFGQCFMAFIATWTLTAAWDLQCSETYNGCVQALRLKDETPGPLLAMTEDAESAILDKYRIEIERKVNEKERQRLAEKQRKEQRSQEREKIREEKMLLQAKNAEKAFRAQQQKEQETQEVKTEAAQQSFKEQTSESVIDAKETTVEYTEDSAYLTSPTSLPTVDDAAVQPIRGF